ncbi:hypothetical protein BU15DRAFT_35703, partial [Melanogaster broomeanus]
PIFESNIYFAEDADPNSKNSGEIHVKIIDMIYARCTQYNVLLRVGFYGSHSKPPCAVPQLGLMYFWRKIISVDEIGLATATTLTLSVLIAV